MTQTFGSIGASLTENKLTEEVRMQAQPLKAFAQIAQPDPLKGALGLGEGATGSYVFAPDVDTQGGRISENSVVPQTGLTPIKTTYTIYEYANSIPYTNLLALLSTINVEDVHIQALLNDYQKAWNTSAYDAADGTHYQAVMQKNVADYEFVTDNTPTKTQDTDLDLRNAGKVVVSAEENNIPYYDGEDYVAVISPKSAEEFSCDATVATLLSRDSGRAALNNELGRVKNTRWVKDNHALTVSTGTYKEWFLFGADAVVEEIALPIEIRMEDADFRRSVRIAWYMLGCHFRALQMAVHSREHVIKVTSA